MRLLHKRFHNLRKLKCVKWVLVLVGLFAVYGPVDGNPDAKRLYDDLLSNYNRLIRPVSNNTEKLTVKLGLRLSQLIDVINRYSSNCKGYLLDFAAGSSVLQAENMKTCFVMSIGGAQKILFDEENGTLQSWCFWS